ncbi:antigen WC1.1-like isoform X2 [Cervus canadensis]|uniref:antigen WC1.1-like isoform X2 n=1 Tax=Cervus canadensis TaxID=1574408 RepID=UPI001CA379A1|nr:antigen WC1.1-like isoform X2 [Cervus canadensis]
MGIRRVVSVYSVMFFSTLRFLSDDSVNKMPCYMRDDEDNNDHRSAPAPDQRTDARGEDYDDAEEVPLPGAPSASQGSEEEVPPEKVDTTRSSQTGSSLNISREATDPGEEESPWFLQGEEADTEYDDVELSALETSIVTFT